MNNRNSGNVQRKAETNGTSNEGVRPMNNDQKRRVTDLVSKTLPHLPRRMFSSNEHNTICFASNLRGDLRSTGDAVKAFPPPAGNVQAQVIHQEAVAAGDCGYGIHGESNAAARKLKIRGLRNFVEKRGGAGVPPSWVKEFPCRSRFHPDMYLYNFEDGPLNPKRNVEALNHCQLKGGRCSKCGIYAASICSNCNYCSADCECANSNPPPPPLPPNSNEHSMLNPFSSMPSMDSFGVTLTRAQQLLASSQNAPKQYPFKIIPPNPKISVPETQAAPPAPPVAYPQQTPFLAPPYQAYQPYQPYGYPPPLPYMIPPPPPMFGYAYPPAPPMAFGYPPLAYPPPPPAMYAYPYQQIQQPQMPQHPCSDKSQRSAQSQPSCKTSISVNNTEQL